MNFGKAYELLSKNKSLKTVQFEDKISVYKDLCLVGKISLGKKGNQEYFVDATFNKKSLSFIEKIGYNSTIFVNKETIGNYQNWLLEIRKYFENKDLQKYGFELIKDNNIDFHIEDLEIDKIKVDVEEKRFLYLAQHYYADDGGGSFVYHLLYDKKDFEEFKQVLIEDYKFSDDPYEHYTTVMQEYQGIGWDGMGDGEEEFIELLAPHLKKLELDALFFKIEKKSGDDLYSVLFEEGFLKYKKILELYDIKLENLGTFRNGEWES